MDSMTEMKVLVFASPVFAQVYYFTEKI